MTHHAATALFFTFGARSLYQSVFAWEGGGEELAEVEKELGEGKDGKQKGNAKKRALGIFSPVLVEVFTLTFLAEWGDRSQIATIGLAASSNVVGVTLGGCLGHAVCTSAAVAGGKGMASMISERAVAVRACGLGCCSLRGAFACATDSAVARSAAGCCSWPLARTRC